MPTTEEACNKECLKNAAIREFYLELPKDLEEVAQAKA